MSDETLINSSSNLNETQFKSLRLLLYEHKIQFTKSSHDLGFSSFVEQTSIESEYDQLMPQSQTADQHIAM